MMPAAPVRTRVAVADVVEADLEEVVARTADVWEDLRGARVLLTGATGFFGWWLLASLAAADRRLGLGLRAVALTRYPERPRPAWWPVEFVGADVRRPFPVDGAFDAVVCAAAPSSAPASPRALFDTIVGGTTNALETAAASGAIPFLLVSSGAVYGAQPAGLTHIAEDYPGGPDPCEPASAYAEGKRAAEVLCALAAADGLRATMARCFSFVGPQLPLDRHFAIGNFLADAAAGRPIEVAGDGATVRSWMYTADLAVWLWTVLLRGRPGRAYNVGSEVACSIADAASLVAGLGPSHLPVVVRGRPAARGAGSYYVPSTARARTELGLSAAVPLEEALARTYRWVTAR